MDNLNERTIMDITLKSLIDGSQVELHTQEFTNINLFYKKQNKEFLDKNENNMKHPLTSIMELFLNNSQHPYNLGNKVEMRNSNVHGDGVFAIRHILKEEIITFYPAHGFELDGHKVAPHNDNINQNFMSSEQSNDYQLSITDKFSIYGNPNIRNKNVLGHMINDSRQINTERDDDISIRNGIYRYSIDNKSNCILLSNIKNRYSYVKAIKNINVNEEIFVEYGEYYWLDKMNLNTDWKIILDEPYIKNAISKRLETSLK